MAAYKLIVMLHMLGACVWIGGHAVLVGMILPKALKRNDPGPVLEFERDYGRLGLGALVVQLATGLWLADRWIGDWSTIFREPTPQAHLILSKLTVLVITVMLAGFTYHKVLPRIDEGRLKLFTLLASVTTGLAVIMLVLGVGIRTGGLFP
ncbi:MAG: CopD family protein [Phycisphaerales bacterium]